MTTKLPDDVLKQLRILEPQLKQAAKHGDFNQAHNIMEKIQRLFSTNRDHHRVLQAKNWYFQAALIDNRIDYAKRGYNSVLIRANENTRTYLEAAVHLGICHLRNNEIQAAKKYIRTAMLHINNIKSDERRNQLQKRMLRRIEFECILGQLRREYSEELDPKELHKRAVEIIKNKSDQEIFIMVGNSLPQDSLLLTQDIKNYSVKLLPINDQKLLAPPPTLSVVEFGKKVVDTVKRAGWRAVCDPESEIYNLWSKQVPKVFNNGYFASAIATTCAKLSIGIPILAVGVTAIIMKYTALEFCERFQPIDLMISRNDKG